jgi:hypothetical protein
MILIRNENHCQVSSERGQERAPGASVTLTRSTVGLAGTSSAKNQRNASIPRWLSKVVTAFGWSSWVRATTMVTLPSAFLTAVWLFSEVFPSPALCPAMYSLHGMKFQNRKSFGGM